MCDAADEASDGARSQLSADLADDGGDDDDDDDDDGAGSCYSSVDNESLNSTAENSAQSHAGDVQSQLPSPHQNAAAAAALISDQYSVETLLANVQALLKLAMDSARHREQQANIKAGQSKPYSCPRSIRISFCRASAY